MEKGIQIAKIMKGFILLLAIQLGLHSLSSLSMSSFQPKPDPDQEKHICEVPVGQGNLDVFCLNKQQADSFKLQAGEQVSSIQSRFKEGKMKPEKLLALGVCIHINQASQEELEVLPGVGPSLARKIMGARPFHSVPDLLGVSGIGFSLLNRIIPLVCI